MSLYADIADQRVVVEREIRKLRQLLTVAVVARDGTLCRYCETPTILSNKGNPRRRTIDHVVPQKFGGSDDLSNLVLACQSCNSRKGSQVDQSLLCPTCRRLALVDASVAYEVIQ